MCRLWTLECFMSDPSHRMEMQWMSVFDIEGFPGLARSCRRTARQFFFSQLAASWVICWYKRKWSLLFCSASVFFIALSREKKKSCQYYKMIFQEGVEVLQTLVLCQAFYGSYQCRDSLCGLITSYYSFCNKKRVIFVWFVSRLHICCLKRFNNPHTLCIKIRGR